MINFFVACILCAYLFGIGVLKYSSIVYEDKFIVRLKFYFILALETKLEYNPQGSCNKLSNQQHNSISKYQIAQARVVKTIEKSLHG